MSQINFHKRISASFCRRTSCSTFTPSSQSYKLINNCITNCFKQNINYYDYPYQTLKHIFNFYLSTNLLTIRRHWNSFRKNFEASSKRKDVERSSPHFGRMMISEGKMSRFKNGR